MTHHHEAPEYLYKRMCDLPFNFPHFHFFAAIKVIILTQMSDNFMTDVGGATNTKEAQSRNMINFAPKIDLTS